MDESQSMEEFWGISRAEYLTLPRSIIQLMPKKWQDKLAELLNEMSESADWHPEGEDSYWVILGRPDPETEEIIDIPDPLKDYRHGNKYAEQLFEKKQIDKAMIEQAEKMGFIEEDKGDE